MKKDIDLDGKRDHLLPQRYMYKRLIVGCSTSISKYFMHIRDENKLKNIGNNS